MEVITIGTGGVYVVGGDKAYIKFLHWPFRTLGTQMEDVTLLFTLGAIPLKIIPFSLSGGCWKTPPKIGCFGHSVHREPQGKIFDTAFSVGVIPVDKFPLFRTIWGMLAGEIPHLKFLAMVILNPRNPNGTFGTVVSLGVIPINKCTFLPPSMGDFGGEIPAPDPAATHF